MVCLPHSHSFVTDVTVLVAVADVVDVIVPDVLVGPCEKTAERC